MFHQIQRKRRKLNLVIFLTLLFTPLAAPASAREGGIMNPSELRPELSALTTCPDVEVIFAHGAATDIVESQDASAWYGGFYNQNYHQTDLKLDYYYLGESTYYGSRYNGANIGISSLKSLKNTAETFFSGGKSGEFNDTVRAGVNELTGRVQEVLSSCPETKFVFGGYSEGAFILHKFFTEEIKTIGLTSDKVIYIATFGDPKLYLPEGEGINPPACRNEAFSDYRIYAPNCHTHSGILGAEKPNYFPQEFSGKIGLWCTEKDIMCSNYLNLFDISSGIDAHLAYVWQEPYLYNQAGNLIRQKLAEVFPDKLTPPDSKVTPLRARDTAILIDTTGSMKDTIKKYQSEALKIAKNTTENGGRIALYEYRDLKADGKELVPHRLCDFSCSYEEFEKLIKNLKTSGGGDIPESVLSASLGVMNELKWKKGATKSIVLLTDATYHDADFDGTTLSDVVKRSLEIDPVNFYIVAPSSIASNYTTLAEKTNGKVFDLSSKNITLSGETLLNRPDLNFQFESYTETAGKVATFIVSTTANDVDHFEWDLNLDGIFELATTTPSVSFLYSTPTSGFIQARVITKNNLSSSASAMLLVNPAESSEEAPIISNLDITKNVGSITASYQRSKNTAGILIFLDNSAIGMTTEPKFTIKDLPAGKHTVALIPASETNIRGEALASTFEVEGGKGSAQPANKSTHSAIKTNPSSYPKIPLAPNTGKPHTLN